MLSAANALGQRHEVKDTMKVRSMDEVVVTGSPVAVRAGQIPYTVTVVEGEELQASGKGQLLSALSGSIPSLFVSERSILGFGVSTGGSGGIKIRGIGGEPTSGVLMMVDGQPQYAGLFSHHIADVYGKEYVDHVEVLSGPGSVLYGSNAMGGVINVITRKAEHPGCHTTFSTQYGSYNTWQTHLTNTARKGCFSSLVSAGFDRTDGAQKGFLFKQGDVYAKMGYEVNSHWTLQADYALMKFLADDPVYPRVYKNDPDGVYQQNVVRGNASVSASNRYRNSNGLLRAYYNYGNHFIHDPAPFHSLDDRAGLSAHQNAALWKGSLATVGFDFATYSGKVPLSGGMGYTDAPMATLRRKRYVEYSPYVTLNQTLLEGRLSANAGIRMANSDQCGTHWIPQVGITAHPAAGWRLRGTVARGFRNPSLRELYLYKTANPDLEPELMTNYELALHKSFSRWLGVELTGFLSKGENMISVTNGKNTNTGAFTNKGIELTANSTPAKWISLCANYSFLHSSLKDLTATPRHQYFLAADLSPHPKWSIRPQLKGVCRLFVAEDTPKQNYAILCLKASYQATNWLQIFASADNITHTQYTIIKGYEMPGITGMGGVKLNF